MASAEETEIRAMLDEMTDAWARGDATAYGAHYQADGTFTNVFGTFHVGHEEFDLRHDEVFRGIFKGTRVTMDIRKLRFLRPDVAALDVDAGLFGAQIQPPGVTRLARRLVSHLPAHGADQGAGPVGNRRLS